MFALQSLREARGGWQETSARRDYNQGKITSLCISQRTGLFVFAVNVVSLLR